MIRLSSGLNQEEVEALKNGFSESLRPNGDIRLSGPLAEEMDEPEISQLPRIVLDFKRENFGGLRELIDAINSDGKT